MTPIQQPRIAILSYSDGRFDGRSRRIAQSARSAGYATVVYARWEPGLAFEEEVNGLRIVRAPVDWRRVVPGLRGLGRRAFARERAAAAQGQLRQPLPPSALRPPLPHRTLAEHFHAAVKSPRQYAIRAVARVLRAPRMAVRSVVGPLVLFPIRPIAWAAAVEDVAVPAEIWHGMWAGSLPALARLRARHGGVSVYDSRDVYLHARIFDRMHPALRQLFRRWERGWAQAADLIVTVNDAYADLLAPLLEVPRPVVVRNCPDPFDPQGSRPDRIRALLKLPGEVAIVLYQGGLMSERGIEQGMDAILEIPGAVFVVMGYGSRRAAYAQAASEGPRAGRVMVIAPVPPEDLLEWTASADVMLMAIQPTTLNHRYTTPQKLWEAIAAGVPVVASDLPGMAEVVREVGCGLLCDPTDPESIAAAIRELLGRSPEERASMRERTLEAARGAYNWDKQARTLLAAYARLLAPDAVSRS